MIWPPWASAADARATVYVDPDVPLGSGHGAACVQAHPHRDRTRRENFLPRDRRRDRTRSGWERDEEGVTLCIDLDATVRREHGTQGTTMLGESLGIQLCSDLLQHARRALDIREQERHRSRRQVTPHASSIRDEGGTLAPMRVGIRLIQYLGSPAEIVDLAVHAEECGLDEVWIPHDPFMTSAWAVTSAIAARTERITIGSIGTNPYTTDPCEIAAYLGTLDLLSHGRAALGLGLHTEEMVRWLGYDAHDLDERLRSSVAAVRALLRGEAVTEANGPHGWGEECRLRFEPLRPDPPVYVAAFGTELLRLGGAIGDGVMPMATPPESVAGLARDIRDGAESAGRAPDDVEIIACAWLSIGEPDGPATARLRQMVATFGPYLEERALATLGLERRDFDEIRRHVDAGRLADAANAVTPEMLRLALVGTVEEAGERIAALGAAGVTNISLGGALGDDPREAIRLVGDVIARRCRDS